MRMNRLLRILPCALVLIILSTAAAGQVVISVSFGPPPLPVYEQPLCPGEGYIWVPGYWAWDDDYDDYYWVPGTWVLAPEIGYLWTPPWWGWDNGVYIFHAGWWGPVVGFYGGIVYGFGYFGEGYVGGRWEGDRFYYNRSVTNVDVVNVHNVYNERVTVRNESHVSFNGGPGGIQARPRPQDEAAARERHIAPITAQREHVQAARRDPALRATANRGRPPVAATFRPGEFHGEHAVPARQAGGEYHPPANRGAGNRAPERHGGTNENLGRAAVHPKDLPPMARPPTSNTGNSKQDQKYQQQQEKLLNRQNEERHRLQQRQDEEHQRIQAKSNPQRQQQMEHRHQQQTQHLEQKHAEQQHKLEQRYPRR